MTTAMRVQLLCRIYANSSRNPSIIMIDKIHINIYIKVCNIKINKAKFFCEETTV